MFETFEHTADIGLRIQSASLSELFAEAARGLFSLIVPDLASVRTTREVAITIAGRQHDYLLFDWLNELLYRYEVEHLLLVAFNVRMTDEGLTAHALGEFTDHTRHELDHEVKAITYHGLLVQQGPHGWFAECIVDI